MIKFIERISHWKDDTLKRLRQRNWKVWLVVVVVGFFLFEVIRAFLTDASKLLLVWVYEGMQWAVRQPMGIGGLALFLYLGLLTGIAWWQSRPRATPQPESPRPLSEEERRLVQDIRTVWNRHGMLAITQLHGILNDTFHELKKRVFWGELLRPIVDNLDDKRKQFETLLDPETGAGISQVRDSFNEMYDAYIQAMKWVAVLQAQGHLEVCSRFDERLQVWRQNHRDMVNRLQDLNEHPEHNQTFNIFLHWVENSAFRKFLREAELSPEWLALMRESSARRGPDTNETQVAGTE